MNPTSLTMRSTGPLSIEPHHDGGAVVVGAHSLARALAEANRVLARY